MATSSSNSDAVSRQRPARQRKGTDAWFYARRGDITNHGRADLKQLRSLVMERKLRGDDLVCGPAPDARWTSVETEGKLHRAVKFAQRMHPSPALLVCFALTATAYMLVPAERLTNLIFPQPKLAPIPADDVPLAAVSNLVEQLISRGEVEQAHAQLDRWSYRIRSGPSGAVALSNHIERAVLREKIRGAIAEHDSHTAWTLLSALDQIGEQSAPLNRYAAEIEAVETRRAALAAFEAAIANPLPTQSEITSATRDAAPYIAPEQMRSQSSALINNATGDAAAPILAAIYLHVALSRTDEIPGLLSDYAEHVTAHTPPRHITTVIAMLRQRGEQQAADALLASALALQPKSPELLLAQAHQLVLQDEPGDAVDQLQAIIEAFGPTLRERIARDPRFDSLRERRDYRRIMR